MLKAGTKAILQRAASHHLGRGTRKENLGIAPKRKFNKKVAAARKKQAEFLKQKRREGQGNFHKQLYKPPHLRTYS